MHARTAEFLAATHCPHSREGYTRLLRERVLDADDDRVPLEKARNSDADMYVVVGRSVESY
jgi:hypothetical protein